MEQLDANQLKSEIEVLRANLVRVNAEKLALDQMYGRSVQEVHALKTETIIKDTEIMRLANEVSTLKKEVEEKSKQLEPKAEVPAEAPVEPDPYPIE